MSDFLQQYELPVEPQPARSALICSVDFYGDGRQLLCTASGDRLRALNRDGEVASAALSAAPICLCAVRPDGDSLEEQLMVAAGQTVEFYQMQGNALVVAVTHNEGEEVLACAAVAASDRAGRRLTGHCPVVCARRRLRVYGVGFRGVLHEAPLPGNPIWVQAEGVVRVDQAAAPEAPAGDGQDADDASFRLTVRLSDGAVLAYRGG